jgi:hypothetical protein
VEGGKVARTLIAKFSSAGAAEHASEKLLMLGYGSEVHELDSIRLARYIASTEYCTERDTGCMEDHATFAAHGEDLGLYPSLAPHYESFGAAALKHEASSVSRLRFTLIVNVEDAAGTARIKEALADALVVESSAEEI